MSRVRFMTVAGALLLGGGLPATAAATATHDGARTFRVHQSGHDLNICGLPATFDFLTTTEWHTVEANGRFHFQLTEVARWTVTFDDPALGVWAGRGTETDAFNGSPGEAFGLHVIFNGREGPVRIHEHLQLVVGADGNPRVDLNQVTTDYGACPS
jgi:hypothetical protein